MTPGGQNNLGFSPGNAYGSPNYYASPAHYHASPEYGSPVGASPIYAGAALNASPTYMIRSPIYQPANSQRQANAYILPGNVSSPQYSPNAPQSPMVGVQNLQSSPAYLTGMNGSLPAASANKSLAYSPTQNLKLGTPGSGLGPSPVGLQGLRGSPSYSPTAIRK